MAAENQESKMDTDLKGLEDDSGDTTHELELKLKSSEGEIYRTKECVCVALTCTLRG